MSDTVTMPKLGFDMQEGTLVRWVKAEGEEVSKGDVLAEIETDKATVEVESSFSGVVARHLVEQGAVVPIGAPIAIVAAPGEEIEEASQAEPEGQAPEEAPPPGEQRPPTTAGGEQAAAETPGQAVESPAAQQVEEEIASDDERPVQEIEPSESETEEQDGDGRVKASPLARKIASESGLDLRRVKGSGPGGRIVRSDVEAAIEAGPSPEPTPQAAPTPAAAEKPAAPKPQTAAVPPVPVWSGQVSVPEDEVVKLKRLRTAIGRRMVESKTQIPHFYVTSTYNVEKLLDLRKQLNEYLPDEQKITVNDFIIKAAALTLRRFPNVNASLRGEEIVRHGHVNIGSAVSIEGGLMTVVIKDADQKPLRLVSGEMRELVSRARSGKVRTEDIEGSTFSISNMGMYDVDHFVAIINPPEAGILAIGSAQQVPVVENGELKVGTRMKATVSIDHRISDGAEAAQFMQVLREYLEEPMRLVL
jgi:pyruvate dehydrogenase E2 component (dihydrolipoamide acetyltransferase)